MALSASTAWEVRTTGSDSSGGGYVSGGTDYSQQDAAQKSGTDLAIHASDNTKVQPVAAGVAAADVGNLIQITAGSGFTTGFYQITAQDGTYWTLDRAAGTTGSTGGTYAMGGALLTVGKAAGAMVAGNTVWVKAGTYSITTTITPPAGTQGNRVCLKGYNATRSDLDEVRNFANFPIIRSNNIGINVITLSNAYARLQNLEVGTTGAVNGLRGINSLGNYNEVINCRANGTFTTSGITQSHGSIWHSQVTGITAASYGFDLSGPDALYCRATGNACPGFRFNSSNAFALGCVSDGNTGASSDGFLCEGTGGVRLLHCVAYNNGRDGIRFHSAGGADVAAVYNCILVSNAAYGLRSNSTTWNMFQNDYNAFYNNTGGTITGLPAGAHDITLTGVPFVNAASNDFSLDNTANEGALCRAAGWPGLTQFGTGYTDVGALQHQDTATCNYPTEDDVRSGTGYGTGGTEFTGTCAVPAAGDVQTGVAVDATTGTFAAPAVGDVQSGVQYGAAGTEFTGTFVVPTEAQVEDGVGFGADGTEFTGTLTGGSGPTAAEIADAVWDEARSGHTAAGSFGQYVNANQTYVDGAALGTHAAGYVPGDLRKFLGEDPEPSTGDLLWRTTIATLEDQYTFTLADGSTDPNAYNGAKLVVTNQATVAQKTVLLVEDYDGPGRGVTISASTTPVFTIAVGDTVEIYSTPAQLDSIKAKTDALPADPADASDIATSFTTVNSKLDTIDDFLDTEVAAIKAKTDTLPSDPADASVITGRFDTVDTTLSGINAKTTNLPSDPADASVIAGRFDTVDGTLSSLGGRLPDALVGGLLKAQVGGYAAGQDPATLLNARLDAIDTAIDAIATGLITFNGGTVAASPAPTAGQITAAHAGSTLQAVSGLYSGDTLRLRTGSLTGARQQITSHSYSAGTGNHTFTFSGDPGEPDAPFADDPAAGDEFDVF